MRFAILSDLHDNLVGFHRVLADSEQQHVDRFIYLGDAGRNLQIFGEFQQAGIACVFGNWEVSGLRRLVEPLASWVSGWPATIQVGQAIFCHATPNMPLTVPNTAAAARHIAAGSSWASLFPRLNLNEQARWEALAMLEAADLRVAFHGHTHIQMVWTWQADAAGRRQLRSFTEPAEFALEAGPSSAPTRYLIGVGSAGQPDDGPALSYAVYDDRTNVVTLRKLPPA
ncbi:MAG: metallophosphoesterase family protein [Chloroflexi bacterium]|nr:metallophosphoesterase family protein [Chloroflexota bacterium]